jgi:hypothetical protein
LQRVHELVGEGGERVLRVERLVAIDEHHALVLGEVSRGDLGGVLAHVRFIVGHLGRELKQRHTAREAGVDRALLLGDLIARHQLDVLVLGDHLDVGHDVLVPAAEAADDRHDPFLAVLFEDVAGRGVAWVRTVADLLPAACAQHGGS